jgi:hypothetical protein
LGKTNPFNKGLSSVPLRGDRISVGMTGVTINGSAETMTVPLKRVSSEIMAGRIIGGRGLIGGTTLSDNPTPIKYDGRL